LDQLSATVTTTDITTCNASNGVITFSSTSGGSGSYEYSKDGSNNWTATVPFTGLAAGTYHVEMRDANHTGCIRDFGNITIVYYRVKRTTPPLTYNYYTTIQAAVNDAVDGDIIDVCAGNYPEHVTILNKSNLTLRGPNYNINPVTAFGSRLPEAILNGTGLAAGSGILIKHNGALSPSQSLDNVIIEGFEISNYTAAIGPNTGDAAVCYQSTDVGHYQCNNITVRNNYIHQIACDGVQLNHSGAYSTNNGGLVIEQNLITGLTGVYSGIDFYYNSGTITNPNYIRNNKIDGTQYAGILISSNTYTNITGNQILNVTEQGVQISQGYGNITISDNTITNANTGTTADKGGICLSNTSTYNGPIAITNNIISGSYNGVTVRSGQKYYRKRYPCE